MFENIAINLRATGPAAVLITWLLCFTAIALFGTSSLASYAQGALTGVGVLLVYSLAQNVKA